MAVTMVPTADALPDVLPSERLRVNGMPAPGFRDELRRIPSGRNAVSVASCWLQAAVVVVGAVWLDNPFVWVAAFLLMGRSIVMFNILGHEAAHRLLFRHRRLNDGVGRWLLSYPVFVPIDIYRRGHMAHHRDELGPEEPDIPLYRGYPITRASMARKLIRDAFGITGLRLMKSFFGALRSGRGRPHVLRILAVQAVLVGAAVVAGRPELYLFLWLLPYLTVRRVLNRLRAIAEHGGMEHSSDKRCTTHSVRQSWLARFWMVPYNTGWHLAHHVDAAVPWRALPRLHDELRRSGWVTDHLEYPSYLALWRVLSSR
jgi:fatty acid desaturase